MVGRVVDNLWLLRTCADFDTFLAMKGRARALGTPYNFLRFRSLRKPILVRKDTTDTAVVWELFRGEEYAVRGRWPFHVVLDCGANVGIFLAWLLARVGVGLTRYVGVEADGDSYATLMQQLDSLEVGDYCTIMQAAVWSADGKVCFDASGPSWGRHVTTSGFGKTVIARTIDSILDSNNLEYCDLVKLDIEGGELAVLPTIEKWGRRVKAVVTELHSGADYAWFSRTMKAAGFKPFQAGRLFKRHPGAIREDEIENMCASGLHIDD